MSNNVNKNYRYLSGGGAIWWEKKLWLSSMKLNCSCRSVYTSQSKRLFGWTVIHSENCKFFSGFRMKITHISLDLSASLSWLNKLKIYVVPCCRVPQGSASCARCSRHAWYRREVLGLPMDGICRVLWTKNAHA